MVRQLKLALLRSLKTAGIFEIVANTKWRTQRLLILCYHGISLEDEHLWRPQLYMPPSVLEQRLAALKTVQCSVLRLGEALERLQANDLPPRSVCVTFDDGTFDFYKQAFPLLQRYQIPATVYQTTYYSDHEIPVFNLICSYMLWKRRGEQLPSAPELGLSNPLDLRTEAGRHRVVRGLIDFKDNRRRIESFARRSPAHFCYPSGVYRKEFFPWLSTEGVVSATTCDAGLIDRQKNPFLLPRFVDTSIRTQVEFESWLSGVGSLIAMNKVSPQRYVPAE